MVKKVLFCATGSLHIQGFHIPLLKYFKECGWIVHVASKGDIDIPYCDRRFEICFERSPFKAANIKAWRELKGIFEENNYDIIHCHTPVGGMLGRIAAVRSRERGARVIYTAHGFHFWKGAPLKNWLIYYPLEKWMAKYTDCLITINYEDYSTAVKNNFRASSICQVHGVGVDLSRFKPVSRQDMGALREKNHLGCDDFILVYAAELNRNKNQQLLLRIVLMLKNIIPGLRLVLAGEGPMMEQYAGMALKMGIADNVRLLGLRYDMDEIYKLADIGVSSSLREGLGLNLVEAMACGKPVVASDNRGHRETVREGVNGFLFEPDSPEEGAQAVLKLYNSKELREQMGKAGRELCGIFSVERSMEEMKQIYYRYM